MVADLNSVGLVSKLGKRPRIYFKKALVSLTVQYHLVDVQFIGCPFFFVGFLSINLIPTELRLF